MSIKRYIEIKFQRAGIHYYPEAGVDDKLSDVNFLGHPHHHYFFFEVEIEVFENNRDIEFIQFSRECQSHYDNGTLELDNHSCEMMAEELINKINNRYPGREITVKVYEDNINGARLVFLPE